VLGQAGQDNAKENFNDGKKNSLINMHITIDTQRLSAGKIIIIIII